MLHFVHYINYVYSMYTMSTFHNNYLVPYVYYVHLICIICTLCILSDKIFAFLKGKNIDTYFLVYAKNAYLKGCIQNWLPLKGHIGFIVERILWHNLLN